MKFFKHLKEQNWMAFAMEFLAVVLGIVITFAGEAAITHYNEQQDVKNSLQLVSDELKDNIGYINLTDSLFRKDYEASMFLINYMGHYQDAPEDSMRMLCNTPLSIYKISPSMQALELLKSSSIFSKIEDKTLALDIIHAYGYIEDFFTSATFYCDKKTRLIDDAVDDDMKQVLSVPGISAETFWTAITSKMKGVYLLHEIRISMSFNEDSKNTRDSVEAIISKIQDYCD